MSRPSKRDWVEAVEWTWDRNRAGEKVVEERRNLLPAFISCSNISGRDEPHAIECLLARADPAAEEFSQHFPYYPEDPVHLSVPDSPHHHQSVESRGGCFFGHWLLFLVLSILISTFEPCHGGSLSCPPRPKHRSRPSPLATQLDMQSKADNGPAPSVRSPPS